MYSKNFMRTPFLPDFIELQRKSFFRLLEKGIIEEISKRNPITNKKKDLELFFYPEFYQLSPPKYNAKQAILESSTYAAKLYIPTQLTDRQTKKIQFKWILFGDLPLMTKRGHFIVNGAARVIINQIIRGPGIYYNKIVENSEIGTKNFSTRYYAEIISMRGAWLRISIDKKKRFWVEMKKTPKIPLLWLLLGMGLNEKRIFHLLKDPHRLLFLHAIKENNSELAKDDLEFFYVNTPSKAWEFISSKLSYGSDSITLEKNSSQKKNAGLVSKLVSNKNRIQKKKQDIGRLWLFQRFMNPRNYDLGLHGRLCFNRKCNLRIALNHRTLTPYDILFATDYLIQLEKGKGELDDIDHLKNRRVRTSSDLIQLQLGIGLLRLEKTVRELLNRPLASTLENFRESQRRGSLLIECIWQSAMPSFRLSNKKNLFFKSLQNPLKNSLVTSRTIGSKKLTPFYKVPIFSDKKLLKNNSSFIKNGIKNRDVSNFITTKPLNGALREFFGTSPLSQFLDQVNPLAEITHKRRMTSLGPGGVSRDTATMAIRGIHPTHYGRICPVETPEGKNAGLVSAITTYARVNFTGLIETPFYKIFKGQVQTQAGLFYFSADLEEQIRVAAPDISVSYLKFLPWGLPTRSGDQFTKTSREKIDFLIVSPIQMISVATCLVPFLEHDDANRALMGANMQRQAVPVIYPENPIVKTGLEAKVASDSGYVIQAKLAGIVSYVSGTTIVVSTIKTSSY